MLAQGDRQPRAIAPYDTYKSDKAGFLTLAVRGEFVALPLLTLNKASLYGNAASIVLEFGRLIVKIEGSKLDDLFEDILLCKVRVVRAGKHPSCSVESIRMSKAVGI